MISIQPVIMGININQFEDSTFSFNNINANIVTKNGESLVSIDAFAKIMLSIE